MTPGRARVLEAASGGLVHVKRHLAEAAGVGVGVVDGLVDEGTLESVALPPLPAAGTPDPNFARPLLSDRQRAAAEALAASVATAAGAVGTGSQAPVILLDGVTGSGKTEVYFEAIAEAVRIGRQALILAPEIALTSAFLDRFAERFGVRPAAWHSGIGRRRRERILAGVASGEVAVVAGARSALFLPFRDLGLLVVDEEHEAAYKQEEGVCYHTRDMAIVRGGWRGAPVVLASATPSIETRVNVQRGTLRPAGAAGAHGGRKLPDIKAVDSAAHPPPPEPGSRPALVEESGAPRRPASRPSCSSTAGAMRPSRLPRLRPPLPLPQLFRLARGASLPARPRLPPLRTRERVPEICPACGGAETLAACGPVSSASPRRSRASFPDKRRIVLSSDFPGGTERLRNELASVAAGEVDIVIGTQLVAKGHNFPSLTLVGVLDADIGLTSGDPRAAERTFQLLHQVTGRAGRGAKPGRALVQTYQPDHPVIAALLSGEAERFYREEIAAREAAGLPPFGRLAALIVSATNRSDAEAHGRDLARTADPPPGVMVLGPAEAPLALIRGRYRFRLLIKAPREANLQDFLRHWLVRAGKPRGSVKVAVDVDPMSFL
jgi:primosomal protein N' (replication factor Y)